MTDEDFVRSYISEENYKILSVELIKVSYKSFCKRILRDKRFLKTLVLLQQAIILNDFYIQIKKSNQKQYVLILEIVFFMSLVEGYMDDSKYMKIEKYLPETMKNDDCINKKEIKKRIVEYQNNYSLTAKVKDFIKKAPVLDKMYLSSSIDEDKKLKLKTRGLKLLSVIISSNELYKAKFEYNRAKSRADIFKKILSLIKGKKEKISLLKIYNRLKTYNEDSEIIKNIDKISIKLYDIRSKFLHTNNKKDYSNYFLDIEKGNIFDFQDINFIRYFIRTVLFDYGYKLNMVNISSKIKI